MLTPALGVAILAGSPCDNPRIEPSLQQVPQGRASSGRSPMTGPGIVIDTSSKTHSVAWIRQKKMAPRDSSRRHRSFTWRRFRRLELHGDARVHRRLGAGMVAHARREIAG